jgi:polysaccharide export outer membrane protein
MIRANGSVISAQQGASFWHSSNKLSDTQVEPGDTLFVPEQLNKSSFIQDAKDWTQILYQFGLGVAGIKSLGL